MPYLMRDYPRIHTLYHGHAIEIPIVGHVRVPLCGLIGCHVVPAEPDVYHAVGRILNDVPCDGARRGAEPHRPPIHRDLSGSARHPIGPDRYVLREFGLLQLIRQGADFRRIFADNQSREYSNRQRNIKRFRH